MRARVRDGVSLQRCLHQWLRAIGVKPGVTSSLAFLSLRMQTRPIQGVESEILKTLVYQETICRVVSEIDSHLSRKAVRENQVPAQASR